MAEHQYVSVCKAHEKLIEYRCMKCSMWACTDCRLSDHQKDSCKISTLKSAYDEIQKENENKIYEHLYLFPKGESKSVFLLQHYKKNSDEKIEELNNCELKVLSLKNEVETLKLQGKRVSCQQKYLTSMREDLKNQLDDKKTIFSPEGFDAAEEMLKKCFKRSSEMVSNLELHESEIMQQNDKRRKNNIIYDEKELKASVTAGKRILVTTNKDNITRYGELDVKEGIFRIHSMHQTNNSPSSLCITLDNCLKTMTGRKEWPTKIFLQISSFGVPLADVIIRLQESSKEATKTVLPSCLFGEDGMSFKGRRFYGNCAELLYSVDWLPVPSDVDVEALLKEKKIKYWNEGEMGLKVWNENNGMEFKFWFCVEGSNGYFELIPTGQVEKGIEVIKDACRRRQRREEVKVLNCGWVLN